MLGDKSRQSLKPIVFKIGKFFGFAPPNFYTFLTLVTGFITAYLILINQPYLAIVFILLSGFMDLVDGAVAKATDRITKFGAMFDSVTDKITEIAVYFGLAFFSAQFYLGATLAITTFMLSSYISKHAGVLGQKSGGGLLERKERIILLVIGLALLPFGTIYMEWILYLIALLSTLTAIQRLERTRRGLKGQ
jgi:phosphatidylglycerophosphate synthase